MVEITVTSKAAGQPLHQLGRKMSAGRDLAIEGSQNWEHVEHYGMGILKLGYTYREYYGMGILKVPKLESTTVCATVSDSKASEAARA